MKIGLKRILGIVLGTALIVLLAATGVTVWKGYQLFLSALQADPLEQRVAEVRAQQNYTKLDTLPAIYTDAVLSAEDKRFYSHNGIDPISIGRAVLTDISAGRLAEGGSTITQQLAKNLYFTQDKHFERKVAEVFMAFAMEKAYSKDEILELYINSIYYGSGYYQIYDAAEGYFGKTPSEMTDAECTLLAGLPNAPSAYSLDTNPDLALQRQRQVLTSMMENGKLTQQQADALLAESTAELRKGTPAP